MEILDNEEISDIISWLPHERGFTITDKKRFATEVMPIYFKESKYTSFTRRLNRWRFTIQTQGHKKASYYHPNFVKGDVASCQAMRPLPQPARKKKPNANNSANTTPKKNRAGSSDLSNIMSLTAPPLPGSGSPSSRGMNMNNMNSMGGVGGGMPGQGLSHDGSFNTSVQGVGVGAQSSGHGHGGHGQPGTGMMPMMPPVIANVGGVNSMPGFQGNFPMYGMPHFAMHPGFLSPSHGHGPGGPAQNQMFNQDGQGGPGQMHGGGMGFYPDNNYMNSMQNPHMNMQNPHAIYGANNFANNLSQVELSRFTMERLGMMPPGSSGGSGNNNSGGGASGSGANQNMRMPGLFPPSSGSGSGQQTSPTNVSSNMNNNSDRCDLGEGKIGSPQHGQGHHQGHGDPLREQEQNDIGGSDNPRNLHEF